MSDQSEQPTRAMFMHAADSDNYRSFFGDLYQGGTISHSWSIITVMQMFTPPGDMWLGPDVFLGSVICFTQDKQIRWMWVNTDWQFEIRETSDSIQGIMVEEVLRHDLRVLTWGPRNNWQLLGDEVIRFDENKPHVIAAEDDLFPQSEY